jgi:hypothetical protein
MILEAEQSYSDFNWFFTDNKNIGAVASAGGRLPESVRRSKTNLQLLTSYFEELPFISDAIVNPKLKEYMSQREFDEIDLTNFIFWAERGLYSFDKTLPGTFSDNRYHLIVGPVVALTIADLPLEISNILSQTIIANGFKEPMNISSFL